MKNLSDLKNYSAPENKSVGVLIGNFDGVHIGHQRLINSFIKSCKKTNCFPVLITFIPHPVLFFEQDREDFLIQSYEEKTNHLSSIGDLDILEIEFSQEVQKLSSKNFIENFLLNIPNLKLIYLGHDFKLGNGKEDSKEILINAIKKDEIIVLEEESHTVEDEVTSSSIIRNYLKKNLEKANKLLGYEYSVIGKVVKGKGIGNKELVATANIELDKSLIIPGTGVYIVKVLIDGFHYEGVANIGFNPTVSGENKQSIEVHVFQFQRDIYGEFIKVSFLKKLREEKKFSNFELLKKQIEEDIGSAKSFFRENSKIRLALIGKDIGHSKSQYMYEKILKKCVNYTLIDCFRSEDIPSIRELRDSYHGVSITSPYKKFFIEKGELKNKNYIAINTLIFSDDHLVYLENTDYLGLKKLVPQMLKKEIFILGDGVMSKILQLVLDEIGEKYEIYSRKLGNLSSISTSLRKKDRDCLVINCCSREYIFTPPKDGSFLFWDLNYARPEQLEKFSTTQVQYIDGENLLFEQAKCAVEEWNLHKL